MSALPVDPVTVGTPPDVGDDAEPRRAESLQQRLASSLAQLRSRTVDPTRLERRIAIIGGTMAAAGVVFVLLGWYGASETSRVYLQIPYLISGGLLGVVLAVLGGCAFLASWLTRLVQEERGRSDQALAVARDTAAALGRIEALLAAGAGGNGLAPAAAGAVTGDDVLVATPTGRLAHRPSCPTVAGRDDLRRVTLDTDGLTPCRMCNAADVANVG